ncbi:DinB family protein [Armatimonas sp.]|uniref:DinB family protein n=1 Tax=Armatimonas sp. TaxID=1872638 RepID=UPI00286C96B5|nr:DinB family protein [Armatimonas sp.]
MNEINNWLVQLDQASHEWLSELGDDVNEAELIWQAFPDGHSIGAVLTHIAEVEAYWLHHIACGEPYQDMEGDVLNGEIDQYGIKWPPPPPHPLSFYKALLATTRDKTKTLIGALENPNHTALRGEREFTLSWLMTHVIVHEAYHGGQAVLLLLEQRKRT